MFGRFLTYLVVFAAPNVAHSQKLISYVDPLIGSAGHGHVFVGVNVPFGAVQLGPTNLIEGWDWCSGYHYSSRNITGFSHTHLSGTGIGDLGDINVMPATGSLKLDMGSQENPQSGWLSTFKHENQEAKAGYYKVFLDRYKITTELTATNRVGFHKYTFPKNAENPHLILDLQNGIGWDRSVKTTLRQIDATTIVGSRYSTGWAKNQCIYFVMKLSQPVTQFLTFDSTAVINRKNIEGKKLKGILNFKLIKEAPLLVKVAISAVSEENAILNLNKELSGWDFNNTVKTAQAAWEKELSKIKINATANTKKVFYTAMYHTMIAPSVFNDVNGEYFGSDKKIHRKTAFTNFTTFSLWDTYRALHPLFTIIHPEKMNDIIKTMLHIYKEQGKLPVWHLMANETDTMVGYPAVPVIVDAYLKGYRDYDVNLAYQAVKQSAMQKENGIEYIQDLKFIPGDKVDESVSKALEYAIGDYCIGLMANALGKQKEALYFIKRAKLYTHYFDPKLQFMRGKNADGTWRTPFNPLKSIHRGDDYTEGNAWQYTWLVPQDVKGLIELFGGQTAFITKLDSLFIVQAALDAKSSPDISGLIGNYAHGNEPGHHIPYLYVYAGQPWKTADLIRKIDQEFYNATPNGLCGNEDVGQMSAWYIFSALGFYPVNPANGTYIFGSPLVAGASIKVKNKKTLNITVKNNSAANKYIQKVIYRGIVRNQSYLTHQMLMQGGKLEIVMGSKPSPRFGVAIKNRPK